MGSDSVVIENVARTVVIALHFAFVWLEHALRIRVAHSDRFACTRLIICMSIARGPMRHRANQRLHHQNDEGDGKESNGGLFWIKFPRHA